MPTTRSRPKRARETRRHSSRQVRPDAGKSLGRSVLVATDGSRAASAAIKLTKIMAGRGAWSPRVITVTLPLPVSVGDMMLPAPPPSYELLVSDSILARMRAQVRRYGDGDWKVEMEFGRPASTIVQAARRNESRLIVVGLGRHGRIGRFFGAETAAHIARHSTIPVLAVHERAWALPRVALVGVDFSDASFRAAQEALTLLEPPGRLHLVHVKWGYNATTMADSAYESAYAAGTAEQFARFRSRLRAPADVEVTTAVLTGGVVDRLLAEARSERAELIAIGSHDEKTLERMMIGSTPTEMLRGAQCSVLVVPPAPADR